MWAGVMQTRREDDRHGIGACPLMGQHGVEQ